MLSRLVQTIRFADGFEVPKAFLPTVTPLTINATISMKAEAYELDTLWRQVCDADEHGFPVMQCVSPVSHNVYTISYKPRRGCYSCNCTGGQKASRLPSHLAEPTCWHLCLFERGFLPAIMAKRRVAEQKGVPFIPPPPVSAATYAADWG